MIKLTKDNIKDVEYSVGCVSMEDLPQLLNSLLDELNGINDMTIDIHGDKASLLSIAWENEHTEYSPERTDPCPDYYGFFYIIKDGVTIGGASTANIGGAMSIDQLEEAICLLDDFVEIDWMNYRYA